MNKKLESIIAEIETELIDLNNYIYRNPEIGFKEFKSSKAHIELLDKHNFKIEENFLDFETAFKASYKSDKKGPTVAYLVEYDALPGIGHGCGHNILGTVSTGAGIALSKLMDNLGGRVLVIGTPAEENYGTKVNMADAGVFDEIDVAMMSHPENEHIKSGKSLSIYPLEFIFNGEASHAAASPEEGINALDACIQTFNNVNALREHLLSSTRIHGIIKEGGAAANIVPERAVAEFYLRTPDYFYMEQLKEKIIDCAKAASLATGAELEIVHIENAYDALLTNQKLSEVYTKNLKTVGIEAVEMDDFSASLDMGNVSRVCPSIHSYFSVVKEGKMELHTKEFGEATLTDYAIKSMKKTIYALAETGKNILEDNRLLEAIKDEFSNQS